MKDDYKHSKEAFVSGMTGSTVAHINMIALVALASIALHSAIRSRLPPQKSFLFLSEWLLLVIPLLLSMTLFARRPGTLSVILLLPTAFICFLFPPYQSGTPLPSGGVVSPRASPVSRHAPGFHHDKPTWQGAASGEEPETTRLSALSTYRAHMMLVTVLAILAVDFPVFPRMLAKCETYGVSFMDMGVGSFVFSQGIVSAIPVIQLINHPPDLRPPIRLEILSVLERSLPVLVLGLLRVVLVKGTQYPEHVTEYGVHWNFFLTLALIPVLRVLLHPLITNMPISLLGLIVASAHQLSLSVGMTSYVLHAARQNLISANKEGLVSLMGYFAIHLLGLSTGTFIIPHSPSYFRRQQAAVQGRRNSDAGVRARSSTNTTQHRVSMPVHRENDKTATVLFSYAVIYWTLFGICRYLHIGGPDVSRRLVNLPYIAWVAAYNTSVLLCYLLLDLAFFATPLSKSTYSPVSGLKVVRRPSNSDDHDSDSDSTPLTMPGPSPMPAPPLLEAVNQNSLAVFLLANVATGVVNLSMRTMYASNGRAMCVLGAYAFGMCAFAWAMRGRRVWKL
ncbi:GWT1-domain-containing protein [Russula ochroleuca]|uniref:GPI-anchored wall transfer protein n=1 Tax=Russula ochroleuca TaxID=152965 RepID=A0A9P5JVP2_9AGAM|nr:GWT1-domain-containing protein [Russula ochroleuca]